MINDFDIDKLAFTKEDLYEIIDNIVNNSDSTWQTTNMQSRYQAKLCISVLKIFVRIASMRDLRFFFKVFVSGFFDLYYRNERKKNPLLAKLESLK
tara:strand:- start:364 stop:651 length:288 start_codon:yes stop_codon:yes gene_type:complete